MFVFQQSTGLFIPGECRFHFPDRLFEQQIRLFNAVEYRMHVGTKESCWPVDQCNGLPPDSCSGDCVATVWDTQPIGCRQDFVKSELDPFEFSLLDSGHLVLFRKVWRDGRRVIQGLLIEQQPFLQPAISVASSRLRGCSCTGRQSQSPVH